MPHRLHRLNPESLHLPGEPRGGMHPNLRLAIGVLILLLMVFVARQLPELRDRPPAPVFVDLPRRQSLYLTAGDGTRLAADVWLPVRLRAGETIGTVLRMTRDGRASPPPGVTVPPGGETPEAATAANLSLALVVVEARGTGASFGSRAGLIDARDLTDLRAVVDWIVGQPWSNGAVAGLGEGFDGILAELLATSGHPAVRAAALGFAEFDLERDLVRPGGLNNLALQAAEQRRDRGLEASLDGAPPAPVDGPNGAVDLAAARRQHGASRPGPPSAELLAGVLSPGRKLAGLDRAKPPLLVWAGWPAGATAQGGLSRFASSDVPVQVLIGPWSFGGAGAEDPLLAAKPVQPLELGDQLGVAMAFCRNVLDVEQHYVAEGYIRYYEYGTGTWRMSDRWPPAHRAVDWYLAAGGRLSRDEPLEAAAVDAYTIDPTTSAGAASRWRSRSAAAPVELVVEPSAVAGLLRYTTPPLADGLGLAGNPLVTLELASSAADVSLFAYLDVITPAGTAVRVSDGCLRATRRAEVDPPPYQVFGPFHRLSPGDARPLPTGQPVTVRVALQPLAVAVPPGGRVRLSLAGADAGTFERVPAAGRPVLRVFRNAVHASRITLPHVH